MPCQILVGTSGYSYTEWTEAGVYPAGTQPGRMLGIYAQRFPAVELNYTWYQMPKADALERMQRQVPETFRFSMKLNRSLTHEVTPDSGIAVEDKGNEGIGRIRLWHLEDASSNSLTSFAHGIAHSGNTVRTDD